MAPDARRVVLITGATSDIGQATARAFALDGWDLALWHRSRETELAALVAELQTLGAQCSFERVDFVDSSALEQAVQRSRSRSIDALVNNAGGYAMQKRFSELSHAEVMDSLAVNFIASFLLASALFEGMADRGFGRIVNISSVAAKYGGSSQSMQYGCAKRALEGITRTLAREGAEKNVLVNTVRPGVIDTGFHHRLGRDVAARVGLIPMRRMGTAQEVADLVHYLGSGRNSYITGQTVAVSGGE